ncbi:MAG: carboxypeptidase-like regulatory domain-containing protein [Euryarchaeota archaeon]|nr:carboxypeptidase-like regulatory domain-containing protein [Euryarchaeota archaeon]
MVYLNGIRKTNTSDAYYNATGLSAETTYELSTRTIDTKGNVNTTTWVNQTATTSAPATNGTLSGTITSTNDGTGISGVTVNLTLNSIGTVIASTTTDGNGDSLMTDITPGEYTVTTSKIRFWSNSMCVTVNAGEFVTVNSALWLKGDLNNNGISADAGDQTMMKDASVGKIELL